MQGGLIAGLLQRLALDRREARAWALYDWASSAFYTTIITAVFPVYFMTVAASGLDPDLAQERYAGATTAALAVTALLAPALGALGDARAARKRLLAVFVALGALSTAALFWVGPGDWRAGLLCFALGNLGAAAESIFYDALLPHVAAPDEMDRLSSGAYAVGYLGGGLLLALNLAWIQSPGWFGLPSGPDLSARQATLPARAAFASVALWWALFTLPLLWFVREPPASALWRESGAAPARAERDGALARLRRTFRELKRYRQAGWMLLAFFVYNDGVLTVIRMAGLYAAGREIDGGVVIGTILLVQFVGIPAACLFGQLARRFGAKPLILAGLAVYVAICVFAYSMDTNAEFVVLGILVGAVQGGVQALSRSLFASMIPKAASGEFFAFFAIGEKFAGILGPLAFAAVIAIRGSPQDAILSIIAFFVLGALILARVDVAAGRLAVQPEAPRSTADGYST
jgi:UMF1 family MFS transporter